VDVEPIVDSVGPAHAVLLGGEHPVVEIRDADTGERRGVIRFGTLPDPGDLAVIDAGGPAVAVLFGGSPARVVVRSLDGTRIATITVGSIAPTALEPIGDLDADGRTDLAAIGTLPGGNTGIRIVSPSGGILARNWIATRLEILDATSLPDHGALALVFRHPEGRRGKVVVLDTATAQRAGVFRIDPLLGGASTAAPGGTLVIARRHARSGLVGTAGWDPVTGERRWTVFEGSGFDPTEVDHVDGRGLVVIGHRMGDANVSVTWRDPQSGRRLP
jgi:hypothetical protein